MGNKANADRLNAALISFKTLLFLSVTPGWFAPVVWALLATGSFLLSLGWLALVFLVLMTCSVGTFVYLYWNRRRLDRLYLKR